MNKKPLIALILTSIFICSFLGCTSNIKDIPKDSNTTPKTETFNAPLDAVWNATKRALAEDETFKIMDKSSNLMVTELRTVDAKELSLMSTYFLGKTYKNSYTINFDQQGSNTTSVSVNVKLQAVQVILLSREESIPEVESYLRKKLFDKISQNLKSVATTSTQQEGLTTNSTKAKNKKRNKGG